MNKHVLTLAALSSLLFSAGSLAAPSAEVKVIGELIVPSCEVTMPNNGVVDYGSISHTLISDSRPVSLGAGAGGGGEDIKVKCDAATPLTFKVTDNRLGTASVAGSQNFGLGSVNATGKLGYYTVSAMRGRVDGEIVSLFATATNTIPATLSKLNFEHGKRIGWARSGSKEVAVGKEFALMFITEAFLAKRSDMHGGIGEDTKLDGSTTLEFGFGL